MRSHHRSTGVAAIRQTSRSRISNRAAALPGVGLFHEARFVLHSAGFQQMADATEPTFSVIHKDRFRFWCSFSLMGEGSFIHGFPKSRGLWKRLTSTGES
jgi:hypothetical protein